MELQDQLVKLMGITSTFSCT